jgi:hypothetical protein
MNKKSITTIKNQVTRQPNQSLVGSVVIDAEIDKDDYGSIPRNCDRKRIPKLTPKPNSTFGENQKLHFNLKLKLKFLLSSPKTLSLLQVI